jgi:hypothetical protein
MTPKCTPTYWPALITSISQIFNSLTYRKSPSMTVMTHWRTRRTSCLNSPIPRLSQDHRLHHQDRRASGHDGLSIRRPLSRSPRVSRPRNCSRWMHPPRQTLLQRRPITQSTQLFPALPFPLNNTTGTVRHRGALQSCLSDARTPPNLPLCRRANATPNPLRRPRIFHSLFFPSPYFPRSWRASQFRSVPYLRSLRTSLLV